MKKEDYEICIAGTHRLLFNATEDKPTNILVPTNIAVKPERIELFSKKDKSAPKASRKALRLLLDFPNHVAEPKTGAKLLGLVTLAQAASLYKVQAGTPLPSVQIAGMLRLPASVGDLLRAIQGSEKWAGDGWHLHRPWVIRALYRVGASGPETSVYRYVGGKLTALVGEKSGSGPRMRGVLWPLPLTYPTRCVRPFSRSRRWPYRFQLPLPTVSWW